MPHEEPTDTGVSPEAIEKGFEPLGAGTTALGITMLIFFIMAGLMLWGLFALLKVYLAENIAEQAPVSAAPQLPTATRSPLEPMPEHNDLDWQDLMDLRQRENVAFQAMGWQIDRDTGQAIIPPTAGSAVIARYRGGAPLASAAQWLRFPPAMAPVPAGPQESLPRANIFPPIEPQAGARGNPTSEPVP